MPALFFKNGTFWSLLKKGRIGNVAPAVTVGDVTVFEQTMLIVASDTVTQLTSITTGVTSNSTKGLITTFTPSTAALGATTFTVTNSNASATANIQAYVVDYGGTILTNGVPSVIVKNRTSTGFDIVIVNTHATNALATSLVIGYEIKT